MVIVVAAVVPVALFAILILLITYQVRARMNRRHRLEGRRTTTASQAREPAEIIPGFIVVASDDTVTSSGQLSTETSGAFTTTTSGGTFDPDLEAGQGGIIIYPASDPTGPPAIGISYAVEPNYHNPYTDTLGVAFGGQSRYLTPLPSDNEANTPRRVEEVSEPFGVVEAARNYSNADAG